MSSTAYDEQVPVSSMILRDGRVPLRISFIDQTASSAPVTVGTRSSAPPFFTRPVSRLESGIFQVLGFMICDNKGEIVGAKTKMQRRTECLCPPLTYLLTAFFGCGLSMRIRRHSGLVLGGVGLTGRSFCVSTDCFTGRVDLSL
jgi:hypothetical protein